MKRFDFAPMEGVTDAAYRNLHHQMFGGVDRYWMPFWSPTQEHTITPRVRRDILPEYNGNTPVVPQILTKSAVDFLFAAGVLADHGYQEVNLNLGCPSGTVTAKGKGSGFLGRLPELEVFLDTIFAQCPIKISIKTRMGVKSPEEFGSVLDLLTRYPMAELTVHPRITTDMYRHPVRPEGFTMALERCTCPVICNGDLKTVDDCRAAMEQYPTAAGFMAGRGFLADPAMGRRLRGGGPITREELRRFNEELFDGYEVSFGGPGNAMLRMKAHWRYFILLLDDHKKLAKQLQKSSNPREFRELSRLAIDTLPLRETPQIDW